MGGSYCGKSRPLKEGKTKGNRKVTDQTERLAPPPPLSRVMREGSYKICINCGSTASRRCLFGEVLCHNEFCPNSEKRFI